MANNRNRIAVLAARIAELEKRRRNEALFPDVIEIVGVERGADGELVEVSRFTLWRRDDVTIKSPR